jgi:tetratricopeptide (TPR) repeat protein
MRLRSDHRGRHRLIPAILLLALAGCTTPPQTLHLRQSPPADLPSRVELQETPFHPQARYQCGPAALATLLNQASPDAAVEPAQLVDQVYVPSLKGSLQASLLSAASRRGLLSTQLDGRLDSLLRELAAGNPVLVLQNLGFGFWPYWHYAVVFGYDLPAERLWLRSGRERRLERSFSLFEKTWERAGRWAMVVTQPERLPETADRQAIVDALLRLERNEQAQQAMTAYRQALLRWPQEPLLLYGLGNSAYAAGEPAQAEQAYLQLLALHPDRAEVWNNLAYARRRQGKRKEAIEAIEQARRLQPDNLEILYSYREITGKP